MQAETVRQGREELRAVIMRCKALLVWVALFGLFANLLLLTGPLYMLQVYDRVLSSGSVETLVALTVLMVFLYFLMGLFDFVRGRIMTRVGMRFFVDLRGRVFAAILRKAAVMPDAKTDNGMRDLENIQHLLGSPVVLVLFDLPWVPIFFAAIFIFHPLFGALALGGAVALVCITLTHQALSRRSQQNADHFDQHAGTALAQTRGQADTVRALSMQDAALARWEALQEQAGRSDLALTELTYGFSVLSKTLRIVLQSAMLGLGAWLVMAGAMTPGGMIAGSVLLGRALTPVEGLLAGWFVLRQGRQGWTRLCAMLGEVPAEAERIALPHPKAKLNVNSITVVPPGERVAALKSVAFSVEPGQAVGVIGPSGAGKSSLARTLVGLWPPAGGQVTLDGAPLDQYGAARLGTHIGYLPQDVRLFDGTLSENIARLTQGADEARVIEAAQLAGAHEMIVSLPQGYDTQIQGGQTRLSGGQLQRIGLARALYGDPAVLVLDEPNANLDNQGSEALNAAIRTIKAQNRAVLVMAHRPAAIRECEMLLMLEGGMRKAFGPRDEVLSGMVKNAGNLRAVAPVAASMR